MGLRLSTSVTPPLGTSFTERFSANRFDDLERHATAFDGKPRPASRIISNLWNFAKPRRFKSRTADFTRSFTAQNGARLGIDVYLPQGPAPEAGWPSVLIVHGSAFLFGKPGIGHARIMADALTRQGVAVLSTDYRKIPQTHKPWTWAFWRKWRDGNLKYSVDDVGRAVDWIHGNAEELGLDARRFGIAGFSAGAMIATLAAAHHDTKISALVSFYAPNDPGLFGGLFGKAVRFGLYGTSVSAEERRLYDPLKKIYNGPTFLIHGAKDTLCHPAQAFKLAHERYRRGLETYLHVEENAGHGFMNDPSDKSESTGRALELTAKFLDEIFRRV